MSLRIFNAEWTSQYKLLEISNKGKIVLCLGTGQWRHGGKGAYIASTLDGCKW